jgi:hypothetical protein
MQQLSRAKRREIQNYNKEKFEVWLNEYAVTNYNAGVREAYMALLLELHDKFGFGNERIQRLLKASEPWMQALINGKEGIDVEGIKQTLIDEWVTCIKETDL